MSTALLRLPFAWWIGIGRLGSLEIPKWCNNGKVKQKTGIARVQGYSMVPTLVPDDRVLVRYGSRFSVGDLIVFTREDNTEIKRIERIEDDGLFVVGDNDLMSLDSRTYGLISPTTVLGRAIARLWPHPGHVTTRRRFRHLDGQAT
jgi:nickel-type superoxide dismutase maturation protease